MKWNEMDVIWNEMEWNEMDRNEMEYDYKYLNEGVGVNVSIFAIL